MYKRILIYSARRQHSRTIQLLVRGLGFVHYKSVTGRLGDHDRVIVQYESSHRLGPHEQYDLVIVDEIRGVAGQICVSATNGSNLVSNYNMFMGIHRNRHTRVAWLGADVSSDGMVKCLADELFTRQERAVHRYTRVALRRSIAPVDEVELHTEIRERALAGKRLAVVFSTRRDLVLFLNSLEDWGPSVQYAAFARQDGDTRIEQDTPAFADIDGFLQDNKIQLMLYTSSVTMGADIKTPVRFCVCHRERKRTMRSHRAPDDWKTTIRQGPCREGRPSPEQSQRKQRIRVRDEETAGNEETETRVVQQPASSCS